MSDPAGRARGPLASALARGVLAFAGVALAGQAFAFAVYLATGLYRPWSWVKIGLSYALAFCGVAIEVTAPSLAAAPYRVRLTLMLGSALVAWVAFRGGRAVVRTLASERPTRAAAVGWGAAPCVPFAILAGLSSLLITLRFPGAGIERLRPVVVEAFALPLVLVGIVGAAGGVAEHVRDRPTRWTEAAAGAWRMFAAALLLAFGAVLVLAALEPRVTGGYARVLGEKGAAGPVLFGHHLLLVPDQSLDVLAASMAGTAELVTPSDITTLTVRGLDPGPSVRSLTGVARSLDFPNAYLLFLAVPAIACVMGGSRAAAEEQGTRERVLRGAGAGVLFAVLVGIGVLMATVTVSGPSGWLARLGPAMPSTMLLALLWGVGGGIAGALLPGVSQTDVSEIPV